MISPLPSDVTSESLDAWLLEQFVCPVEHAPLRRDGDWLINVNNPERRYPIVNEIPVFLRSDIDHTAWWSQESLRLATLEANGQRAFVPEAWDGKGVHPHVQEIIAATGGYLYQHCEGELADYPIPSIRVKKSTESQLMLDGGCNWGRWTFAAARAGIPAVGVDPSLGAVDAARKIRNQLGLPCAFFVGDCRWLPFPKRTFSDVFSYSVIQHFSKEDAREAITEFERVLAEGGRCLVQMPNRYGVRSTYHLAKRRFRAGEKFDVRYYTPSELRALFRSVFGNAELSVDGFFGLGIQADDLPIMTFRNRVIIRCSEALRHTARVVPPLKNLADSLYILSSCQDETESQQQSRS